MIMTNELTAINTEIATQTQRMPFNLKRDDCFYLKSGKVWTEYKGNGGISVHVNIELDDEINQIMQILECKAEQALEKQLNG